MSDKPLCGYCYKDVADDCCDKRRIDVLERQLEEVQKENTQLKEMREHLKGKDETRKEKERLERQLEEDREENEKLVKIMRIYC